MGIKGVLFAGLIAVAAYAWWKSNCAPPTLPTLDLHEWWGPAQLKAKADNSIRPFQIQFTKTMIEDLRFRLKNQRRPPQPLEGVNFNYGFNTTYLQTIVDFWRNSYDFAEREKFLNRFPQFKTQIQGLDIHFIHVKPKNVGSKVVVPLLLLHGWPGSVREFYEVIPLLTEGHGRDFVFEVVVPSLPGYGFSESAVRPGLGAFETAIIMRNLMQRLGYKEYYLQGGDWGATVTSIMATAFPGEVLGLHSNMPVVMSNSAQVKMIIGSIFPSLVVESKYVERMYPYFEKLAFLIEEMGYMHLQATKPDTVGVALSDSPAGLAAYILEKFSTWTNPAFRQHPEGDLTKKFKLVDLLDNLMFYWTGNSITTSMRMYSESLNKRVMGMHLDDIPTPVPTWALKTRHELMYYPDGFLKVKYVNLLGSTDLEDGGHFAAFELPNILAEDVFLAVGKFREFHAKKNSEL